MTPPTRSDEAVASFRGRFTCSSAVFSAFSDKLGLDPNKAKKIACGFGAGMSKTGNTCGAVSGAIMVIGLKYGKVEPGDDAATEKTRALTRQFIDRFTAKNGSINCTELLGCNLADPEEFARARDSRLFTEVCPGYVRDAAGILERIL
jgi:C_GCAxxG_C_C family probable redox protein